MQSQMRTSSHGRRRSGLAFHIRHLSLSIPHYQFVELEGVVVVLVAVMAVVVLLTHQMMALVARRLFLLQAMRMLTLNPVKEVEIAPVTVGLPPSHLIPLKGLQVIRAIGIHGRPRLL